MPDPRTHGTIRVAAAAGAAGLGIGWMRAADSLADVVPPIEIEGIWLFPPVRREEREWGVAVVSRRAENDRRRIYTVSYMLVMRGRERGQGKVAVEEVERDLIEKTLRQFHGNRTHTARAVGLSRRALQLKIKKFGLVDS